MDEGQGWCGLLKGLVPRVVVAMYEDNTPRTKKVMIQVQVCERQRRQDYNNTFTFFFQKKKKKIELKTVAINVFSYISLCKLSGL
jgi:hypothetical protein